MPSFYDLPHVVSSDEIDAQLHVHNLRYLQWTLWAASKHTAACGWDEKAASKDGMGWVVRKHEITYRAAALEGDELVIRTWISDIDRYASMRKCWICRPLDRRVLAKAETRWVYVNLRIHKVVPIPDQLRTQMMTSKNPPLPWDSDS